MTDVLLLAAGFLCIGCKTLFYLGGTSLRTANCYNPTAMQDFESPDDFPSCPGPS